MTIKWVSMTQIADGDLVIRNGNMVQAERDVLMDEARESFLSAKTAINGNPTALRWLVDHHYIWRCS